jgi:hypothetical protein
MNVLNMEHPQSEILNSWKEIARYLDRGVRTVQRWERELHLPVRRPRGKRRSAVLALRREIDAWLNCCPQAALEEPATRGTAAILSDGILHRDRMSGALASLAESVRQARNETTGLLEACSKLASFSARN